MGMGTSSNLLLSLLLSVILLSGIASFQPFAFADDDDRDDDDRDDDDRDDKRDNDRDDVPQTLESECAEELEDDDFDLEGLFCLAISALQDAIDDLLNRIIGLESDVNTLQGEIQEIKTTLEQLDIEPIFEKCVDPGCPELISISTSGEQGIRESNRPSISADNRFVVFDSTAPNLVLNDNNFDRDVFLRDLVDGTTILLSVSSDGTQGNEVNEVPSISSNGRYVTFHSLSTNLIPNDNNGRIDVFVRDLILEETWRASQLSDGTEFSFGISAKIFGNFVVFEGERQDSEFGEEFWLHNLVTRETEPIGLGVIRTGVPTISHDARFVAFSSNEKLTSDPMSENSNIFVYDRILDEFTLVNVPIGGVSADKSSFVGIISADGRFVFFSSTEPNLVPNDENFDFQNIFVRDLITETTELVSILPNGEQTSGAVIRVSSDGSLFAFEVGSDIYIRDRDTSTTTKFTTLLANTPGEINPPTSTHGFNEDFDILLITSRVDLIPEDVNELKDVYLVR